MATPETFVPLRQDPSAADDFDAQRAALVCGRWDKQTEPLRRRDRKIEESLRMLAGEQWLHWNAWLQRYIDVTEWMTDEERRWRQRPVINRLLYWYIITHSRLTESPPIITFQPANADRLSAMLAESMDTIWKGEWRRAGMLEVLDRMVAWLIPGGRVYAGSALDLHRGEFRPWIGEAMLPVMDEMGMPVVDAGTGQPAEMYAEQVPYDKDGKPLAAFTTTGELQVFGEPHAERRGGIRVDVYSPLQCRGQWGPTPWHEKKWHTVRSYLTPEEVWEMYNVQLPPDRSGITGEAANPGFLERIFFGSGFYGAASGKPGSEVSAENKIEPYIEVLTQWEKPCPYPGLEESQRSPGGRLTIVARETKRVLLDMVRPFRFRYTSGIRCFDFVNVPGRPSGTSPQEMLDPLQKSYNRFSAQIMEAANLIANPIGIIDQASGLGQVTITNKPGARYVATPRPGVKPFEFVQPPSLSRDVYQAHLLLKTEMQDLGHLEGAEGRPPATEDPSGKLVQELRKNSDRFLGSTSRRMVEELARMGEDWTAILEVAWTQEDVVAYAGEDNVTHTIAVFPEMFQKGQVQAVADIESMLPESRAERQNKMFTLWQASAWGPPETPQATQKFLEVARFPHMSMMAWPGGVHIVTARQENGRLARGAMWDEIQVFEWYDDLVHLGVHEQFMSSPEFLKLDQLVQMQFVLHRQVHMAALQQKLAEAALQQGAMANAGGNGGGNGGPPGGGEKQGSATGNKGGGAKRFASEE